MPPSLRSHPCDPSVHTSGVGTGVGAGDGIGVGAGVGIVGDTVGKYVGLAVGAVVCTHVFAAFAVRQFSTHVQPTPHMQNQSSPTSLHTPPACASHPCDSAHGSTVGTEVGATVGATVGITVGITVGATVARTHTCASWLS